MVQKFTSLYKDDPIAAELEAGIQGTDVYQGSPYALANIPEFEGVQYATPDYNRYQDLYGLYMGGGFDAAQPDFVTPPADTTPIDTGGGDGGGGNIVDQLETDTGIDAPINVDTPLTQMITDPVTGQTQTVRQAMTTNDAYRGVDTTPDYSDVTTAVAPPSILNPYEPQSMLASEMIEAQKANQPVGLSARGTIDRTPASQALDDEYYEFDTVDQQTLDAPYGVNPNTGIPYQEPRTIADQNRILGQTFEADEVDAQGNLLQKGVDKLKEMGIDPVVTAFKLGVNTIVGKPISLLADVLGAMDLPGGPTFQTQKAIELGLAGEGETQDIYGINTQSAFGNYDEYNVDRVEELEDIVADQISRGLTNTIQMRELEDRREYVDKSGAGGNIQPDATDLDIATGVLTSDAAAAEAAPDLDLQAALDRAQGVETGDAAEAERIAAENRAAAEEVQRIENERAANAREQAAQRAREAAAAAANQGSGNGGGGDSGRSSGGGYSRGDYGGRGHHWAKGGRVKYSEGGIVSLKNGKR